MSNLAKHAITIPSNVSAILNQNVLSLIGPLGTKTLKVNLQLRFNKNSTELTVTNKALPGFNTKPKAVSIIQGSTYALIKQYCLGVSMGFRKKLTFIGVGYRVAFETHNNTKVLILKLGYSHTVRIGIPKNLTVVILKPTLLSISGIDKQTVNLFASIIKSYKTPEPYKGKGIRYQNEHIPQKEGKRS